jgi:hypothetical protein
VAAQHFLYRAFCKKLSFKLKEKQKKQTIRPRTSTVVVKTAAIPPDEERQQALIATMPLAGVRCVIAL